MLNYKHYSSYSNINIRFIYNYRKQIEIDTIFIKEDNVSYIIWRSSGVLINILVNRIIICLRGIFT